MACPGAPGPIVRAPKGGSSGRWLAWLLFGLWPRRDYGTQEGVDRFR
jgi:hypothetical protein